VLLLALLACAPNAYRIPGPLASLGEDPAPEWLPRRASPSPLPRRTPGAPPPAPLEIAAAAARFVGDRSLVVDGERFRFDCSGLVEAALASAGCAFTGSTAQLFEQAREHRVLHRRRVPTPGDVAFFDDTYDRDGDGRRNDALSHIAVVETVDAAGTITLVHVGSEGVTRFLMNLKKPDERHDGAGSLINSYLRARKKGDSPRTRYLSGELWVAFGSFWDAGVPDQVASAERSTR
jgi:hypothetical protein